MKNKKLPAAMVLLAAVTVILAALHLKNVPQVSDCELLIQYGGEKQRLLLQEETMVPVSGTLVTGKGAEIPVDAMGLSLADVLSLAGVGDYTWVTVTARDEYRAEVSAREVRTGGNVYLILDTDSSFRLVVFGDSNSKRNVSDVTGLTIS